MNRKLFLLIGFLILLLPTYAQSKHKWEKTIELNSVEKYKEFILKYPYGKYTYLAINKLDSLEFSFVKKQNTREAYEEYLSTHKNPIYSRVAKQFLDDSEFEKALGEGTIEGFEAFLRIQRLETHSDEVNEILDSLYFEKHDKAGTISSYEYYIANFTNRKYTKIAIQILDSLLLEREWENVKSEDKLTVYDNFLTRHPESVYTNEALERKSLILNQREELDILIQKRNIQGLKDFCVNYPKGHFTIEAQNMLRDLESVRNIVDLLDEGKIEVNTQGEGIERVSLKIRKLVDYPLNIKIPAGSYFVSSRKSSQNMVTTSGRQIRLANNSWVSLTLAVACANRPLDIPGRNDSFTIQQAPNQEELVKLMPIVNRANVNFATRQAAVWLVTDDATYAQLGILVLRSEYQYDPGERMINETEVARAIKLCVDAGIDIYSKQIWNDSYEFVSSIKDEQLKKFIKDLQIKEFEDDVNKFTGNGDTPLIRALKADNFTMVKYLINSDGDVNKKNRTGDTPLTVAVNSGNIEMAKYLINAGASIHETNSSGDTPLEISVQNDDAKMLNYLISKGADIEKGLQRNTPLLRAVKLRHIDIVKILIDAGANVDAVGEKSKTPLIIAIEEEDAELVKILLSANADVNRENSYGDMPLMMAFNHYNSEIIHALLEAGADIDQSGLQERDSDLLTASKNGDLEIVQYLLLKNVDVNQKDIYGFRPVIWTLEEGHVEVAWLLIEYGADILTPSKSGFSALFYAAQNGCTDILKYLIEKGADVNLAVSDKYSPLYMASGNGHLEAVQLLVQAGADLNKADDKGNTPLINASISERIEVVKFLIESGADIRVKNNEGKSAPDVAKTAEIRTILTEALK